MAFNDPPEVLGGFYYGKLLGQTALAQPDWENRIGKEMKINQEED
jgi:hypothetical protein